MSLRETIPSKIHEIFERTYAERSQKDLKEIILSVQSIVDEIEGINLLLNSSKPDYKMMKELSMRKQNIYLKIKDLWTQPVGVKFDEAHTHFNAEIEKYIKKLPKNYREEQSKERFVRLESDSWHLKHKKRAKYLIYRTSILPKRIQNWLLVIFRKKPHVIRFWFHVIPVRKTIRSVYQAGLIRRLLQIEGEKYRKLLEIITQIKTLDYHSDLVLACRNKKIGFETALDPGFGGRIDVIKKILANKLTENKQGIQEVMSDASREFSLIMDKANTIEMPSGHFSTRSIEQKYKRSNSQWQINSIEWSRTLYALFDDWRLDLEINRLKYLAYEGLFQAKRKISRETREYISGFNRLSEMLERIGQMVNAGHNVSRKRLQEIKNFIQKELDGKVIPETLNGFDLMRLTGIFLKIREKIENEINSISESRALVKSDLYLSPLRAKDINFIKPNELISFEVFPQFLLQTEKMRKLIDNFYEEIVRLLPDLDNIVLFSIDTAINSTPPDQDEINPENTKIILNGIARAQNRLDEFEQLTLRFFNNYYMMLFEAISKFTANTTELMQNENALNIRIKLVKAKTLHRTRRYEAKFRRKLFRRYILAKNIYRNKSVSFSKIFENYRKRFYLSASDTVITNEISDFLSSSTDSIDRLPVIFRRLYHVEPVLDMELFVGRKKELSNIRGFYQKWQNNRPVSVAVVGDKWGGLSSMINYLMVNLNLKHPVIRITPIQKYYNPEKMCRLISVSFSMTGSENPQEIIKEVKASPVKRIVIIEDLQHFFLRTVHGFDSLRMLIDIIKQTYNNVFWICTCTKYAWNYLVKSIQIDDLFQHVVQLSDMSTEEISNVIKRRNLIGGFKIVYIPPVEFIENKKFVQLDSAEQQAVLEKRFIKRMNDFAQSNISMALIFWLLSTREVTDDKIMIGDFVRPDHSYLYAMSQQRIYILLALILHDGLNLPELARVNNQLTGELQFHLTCLEEDGIIENLAGQYFVNPLIYRQVVIMLTSKNLIH